jgi:FtsP/CotA-like multicopper oxidase with cupredoxin domain
LFTRREFLELSGRIGLAATLALGDRALIAAPNHAAASQSVPRETTGGIRQIHLETREVDWELAPGKRIKAMAYNGQIPGPEIRLKEGERVRIVLKNMLQEPTTIHWHGVDVPARMDGVPQISQTPVAPGGTFIYEFEARPSGTRWYHTHAQEHRQLDLGLYAPLVIEPARPDAFAFDREYTLVLDDWVTGTGRPLPRTQEGTAGGRGRMAEMMRRMMGRGGMGGMRASGDTPAYDIMTINGKAYPATRPLAVRKGERVRLRLINASSDHTHVIRLAGHTLTVTHTDGNPLTQGVPVEAVSIAPGERYDVLFVANRPGAWFLSCGELGHAEAGEQVLVIYAGSEKIKPEPAVEGVAGLSLWRYSLGRGRQILPSPWGQQRTFDLTLSGGMMEPDVWTINGLRYPSTEVLRLRTGDRGRMRLSNMSMEAHPMHLHGQSFTVLAVNGRRLAVPLTKDTVDVAPHMGSVDIEFTASNPGQWWLHCHKPMHMQGGMISLVAIG